MILLGVLVAAALVSLTTGTTAFARVSHEQPCHQHENYIIERHAAKDTKPSVFPTARCIDSPLWIPAPPVNTPSRQPGGVCDFGDSPMIC